MRLLTEPMVPLEGGGSGGAGGTAGEWDTEQHWPTSRLDLG